MYIRDALTATALDFLLDDQNDDDQEADSSESSEEFDGFQSFLAFKINESKAIEGYRGLYLNSWFDSEKVTTQFIQRVIDVPGDGMETKKVITGLDIHHAGRSVWNMRVVIPNMPQESNDELVNRVVVCNDENGEGSVVVNIANADVLPSYCPDDYLRGQVVGFVHHISAYSDEDQYSDDTEPDELGRRLLLDDGSFLPLGMMKNHVEDENSNANDPDDEDAGDTDDLTLVRGRIKAVCGFKNRYSFQDSETTETDDDDDSDVMSMYLCITIITKMGEVELYTPFNIIREEDRQIIFGPDDAFVVAVVSLSADVAIYEYENGFIKDQWHDMKAFQDCMRLRQFDKLNKILADDCIYESKWAGESFSGKDAVILYMSRKASQMLGERAVYPYSCTVTDGKSHVGEHAIALAQGEEDNIVTLAFIEVNGDGLISRITFDNDEGYKFKLDKSEIAESEELDVSICETVEENMQVVAKVLNISSSDEMVTSSRRNSYVKSVDSQLAKLKISWKDLITPNVYRERFSVAFATSVIAAAKASGRDLTPDELKTVKKAGRELSQGYKSFCTTHPVDGMDKKDRAVEEMKRLKDALVYAMILGEKYKQGGTSNGADNEKMEVAEKPNVNFQEKSEDAEYEEQKDETTADLIAAMRKVSSQSHKTAPDQNKNSKRNDAEHMKKVVATLIFICIVIFIIYQGFAADDTSEADDSSTDYSVDDDSDTYYGDQIVLNNGAGVELGIGNQYDISYNDYIMAPNDVEWSSSNENVATVDEFGEITAISAGNTTITATDSDGNEGICNVTVRGN